jgi:hypothetical protein
MSGTLFVSMGQRLGEHLAAIQARVTDWTCTICGRPCDTENWQAVRGTTRVQHPWCRSESRNATPMTHAAQSEETVEQSIARYRRETAHLEVHDTALFLSTDGKQVHALPVARSDELRFVAPAPYFTTHDDGNDGRSVGVPEVERRRQERDVRRELDKARKRLRGAPIADRATWETKVNALEAELRSVTAPRDEERDRQRSTMG